MNDAAGESLRLAALRSYDILDTPPEQGFDDIVMLASQICGTPIALVTLLDRDRQWFKARAGTDICETPIGSAICRHAIGGSEVLVIPDLAADPRTAANPLVTEPPHMRFYAGAPLATPDGVTLGTICVLDVEPRPDGLTPEQEATLAALARQVMAQLNLRRALAEHQAAESTALTEASRLEAMIATQQAVAVAEADLGIVFQAIAEGALRVIDVADGAVIELRHGEELVYETVAGSLVPHKGRRLPVATSLSGRALREERPFLCTDTWADPDLDQHLVRTLGIRSMITVPVTRRGEPIGVLKVQSGRPDAFSPRDVVMTQMLAGLVASAFGDVAEVRSQRALREADRRYRETFESITEFAVIVMDRGGTVAEWNTGAERIFGWSAEEMRGSDASRFFTPEDSTIDRPRIEMALALRDGHAVDERWHIRKDGERFYASGNMMPLFGDDGEHRGFVKILRDRTAEHQAGERLRASEERFRTILDAVDTAFAILEVRFDADDQPVDYRFVEANPAFVKQSGVDLRGKWVTEYAPNLERFWFETYGRVAATGEPASFENYANTFDRWFDVRAIRIGDPAERKIAIFFNDVSERKRAEQQQGVLNHEISHRLKNTLALVSAIVTQTLRTAPDVASARQILTDRIQALSSAHDLLLTGRSEATSVGDIIRSATRPHDQDGRIDMRGPEVTIGPRAALTLSLICHELSTNAVKYGALSAAAGQVHIAWTTERRLEDGHALLVFEWREVGGPPVSPPKQSSFGTRLIGMGLSSGNGASSTIDYALDGVCCRIVAPLEDLQEIPLDI
ncbi:GAF domain-containing protein [Antarcticirhabdus aurantiaca]|uniref:GAF domain-containing protein n=1 Tax=Antarcticirhabdus aurantiaca TaxID=2606717 RepID=A0ACD4NWU1_9HYPH|nr:GAF domain-containing protein [Antarcticirhabdus aurantiaca]WAJ31570.1 GAF domain-containing protein [Jeongeuplla avenae]